MCVYEIGKLRVVDLSKIIDPATETRRCHLFRFNTGGAIPDFHTNMDLMSHLGTHCGWPVIIMMVRTLAVGSQMCGQIQRCVEIRNRAACVVADQMTSSGLCCRIQDLC